MDTEIEEITQQIKQITIDTDPETIVTILEKLSSVEPTHIVNVDLTNYLLHLLKHSHVPIRTNAAKCMAEITKSDEQRKNFTNIEILKQLIDMIMNAAPHQWNEIIQACRALNNICYENDEAREIMYQVKADERLVNLFDISWINSFTDPDYREQFVKVRVGLMSTYLLGGEKFANRVIKLGFIERIERIIDDLGENVIESEPLLLNLLPTLNILSENVPDLSFNEKLNRQLVKILAETTNPDLAELCLDLFFFQAESDDIKLFLAKEGLCGIIYQLLEKYKTLASTNEAKALMKLACELIVFILTGDESMDYLYSTPLFKHMEDWLDSYDLELLTTGVLALGNFARTDKHCIEMVENKIMTKLLAILSKSNGVDDDMRLQHALLSTLRNLVIPEPNKPAVIEAGLVNTILPMLEIHQPPVVFKLLGTLRMTIDGQEKLALDLLQNEKLIGQLVEWSKPNDCAGVTGESLRLMAWLIKHGYYLKQTNIKSTSTDSISGGNDVSSPSSQTPPDEVTGKNSTVSADETSLIAFVRVNGAVECMINMLTSQHLVMQNEALIALSIMSLILSGKKNKSDDINLDQLFIDCDLGMKLSQFVTKSSENMTKEVVINLQTLISLLRESDNLVEHLNKYDIDKLLESIPILTEYCTL